MGLGGRAFGGWLDQEDGALINGVGALIKGTPEGPLLPSFCHEKWVYDSWTKPSPESGSSYTLILDFLASITVRNMFVV